MSREAHNGGTIGDMIIQSLARYPDRVAFVDSSSCFTYRELAERIGSVISRLKALGLDRGSCIAQLSGNRTDVFVLMAACYIVGMRSVTLHGKGGLDDHAYIINDAMVDLFIADRGYHNRLEELRGACPNVRYWYSHDRSIAGTECLWDEISRYAPTKLTVTAQSEDVIRLAYTGGTTGKPKGVMLTNRSMWMQALLLLGGRQLPEEVRLLCPTPVSHGAGAMLVPTLWKGGTVILQDGFDAGRYLRALQQHRATFTFLVPTMIYAILDHPDCATTDFSSLRFLSYGAAPMAPARIAEAIKVFGPVLAQSYGQTECPSNILFLSQEDHVREDINLLGSAGMPYPGVTVALLDETDLPVGDGETGELCVRSPLVMDGYWKQPDLTDEVMRNGWLHTGDMAYRDENGYYFLVDRKKDMIISGGFNVYPKEVENVLSSHEAVSSVAVIGVPDERWGEAVKAIVVLKKDVVATEDELKSLVRAAKGSVYTPKSIDFVPELPLTALGKADKKKLRALYWVNTSRSIN